MKEKYRTGEQREGEGRDMYTEYSTDTEILKAATVGG